jgi:hypothetical protein
VTIRFFRRLSREMPAQLTGCLPEKSNPRAARGISSNLSHGMAPARILRPGLSQAMPNAPPLDSALRRCFQQLEAEINRRVERAQLAA